MRILFDENAPFSLALDLVGHDCETVIQLGWRGIKNGMLLTRAEAAGFKVLITLDDDMEPEQNMTARSIAILVLKPRRQGKGAARELAGNVILALQTLAPGEIRMIRGPEGD